MEKNLRALKICFIALISITSICLLTLILPFVILGKSFEDMLMSVAPVLMVGPLIMIPCYFCECDGYFIMQKLILKEYMKKIKFLRLVMLVIDSALVILYATIYVLLLMEFLNSSAAIDEGALESLVIYGFTTGIAITLLFALLEFILSFFEKTQKQSAP